MALRNRFQAAVQAMFGGVQGVSSSDGWLVRIIGGGKTKSSVSVNYWSALGNTSVWACVTLISDVISQLPIDVFERSGNRRVELTGHPLSALLNGSANEQMGASGMIRTLQMHTLLSGNGYAEIERRANGEAVGIWPLLPECTQPCIDFPQGARRLLYRTQINQRSIDLPSDRVLHLMGYSHDGICGMSPIQVARDAIGLGLAMEEFGSKFFANDAKSGGVLMHPSKLSEKAKENIAESFEGGKGQGGLDNAHKVKVLEEGMRFVPTTISPDDSQFLGGREFQLAEVARIYRVSLVLLSSLQGSTVWGTGIEQLMIGFVTWTIGPWLKRWEEELGRKLLTEQERRDGLYLKFNLNALLRGDMAARAAFYKAGITDGWMTRNEARELEDRNPLTGLDEPLMQANMQLASMAGQETDNGSSGVTADDVERAFRIGRVSGALGKLAGLLPPGDQGTGSRPD